MRDIVTKILLIIIFPWCERSHYQCEHSHVNLNIHTVKYEFSHHQIAKILKNICKGKIVHKIPQISELGFGGLNVQNNRTYLNTRICYGLIWIQVLEKGFPNKSPLYYI